MAHTKRRVAGWRTGAVAMLAWWMSLAPASGVVVLNYLSPRNRERQARAYTDYIVLHTTEGQDAGAIRKIRANGEAHYFVDTRGKVYRIVERHRVAYHAGLSMWNGRANIDNYSIGIEVSGYHDKDINAAQYTSLAALVGELKAIYQIPDDRVLCHSMVAYAAPNRWHRKAHRGRKRCGMLFAKPSVRSRLGLAGGPSFDPDVRARRLVVGDPYLAQVLYGTGSLQAQAQAETRVRETGSEVIQKNRSAWDVAGPLYNSATLLYVFPDGRRARGNEIRDWNAVPPGTRIVYSENQRGNEPATPPPRPVEPPPGQVPIEKALGKTTYYFFGDGTMKRGDQLSEPVVRDLPKGTKVLVGYVCGGYITTARTAMEAAGKQWNRPTTFYRFPGGGLVPGNKVDAAAIPRNTLVFFAQ